MGKPSLNGVQYWRHHVEHYLCGELTLREYCECHQLNRSTFGYWRRRLCHSIDTSAPRASSSSPRVTIVRVDLATPPPATSARYEVVLGNGRCIRLGADFDAAALARLVQTLEGGR